MLKSWQAITLWKRVLIALVLGMVVGLAAHYGGGAGFITTWIKPFGDAFVRLIKMLIIPVIFTTLVVGVMAMGDPKRLGSLGIKTLALYMGTTFFAVTLGLIFGSLIQPGLGIDLSGVDPSIRESLGARVSGETPSLTARILAIIPENPIRAMVENDIIAVIFFSIFIGVGISPSERRRALLRRFLKARKPLSCG